MRRRRGSALFILMAGAALLLSLALLFASASLSTLEFSASFSQNARCEQLARAALTQFCAEAAHAPFDPLDPATASAWLQRFENEPIFRQGESTLGGQAWIHFDQNRSYFSLDNSSSEQPGAGWIDLGTTNHSVPPYSYELILEVRPSGGPSAYYQAVLQRRWPYAVAHSGTLLLRGNPFLVEGLLSFVGASSIEGSVYATPHKALVSYAKERRVSIGPETYMQILSTMNTQTLSPPNAVSVGGPVTLTGPPRGNSRDNLITGRVDFAASDGVVQVAPGNSHGGGSRTSITSERLANLVKLVDFDQSLGTGGRPPLSPQESVVARNLSDPDQPPFIMEKVWVMDHNVEFGPNVPDVAPDGVDVVYGKGSSFFCPGTLTNRWIENKVIDPGGEEEAQVAQVGHRYPTSLVLQDCQLYVQGNLDLSGQASSLKGTNSTLIVEGTLVLNGGSLDALEDGMVIACKRLVAMCSGEFRGLVLVTESAILVPPATETEGLTIHGGLVCAGDPVVIEPEYMLAADAAFRLPENTPGFLEFDGLSLYNTRIVYEPRYLKRLNPAGQAQILFLRKLP